jgi:RecB family exonuclease
MPVPEAVLLPFGDRSHIDCLLERLARLVEEGREEEFALLLPSRHLLHAYRHRLVSRASRRLNLTTFDDLVAAALAGSGQKVVGMGRRLVEEVLWEILEKNAPGLPLLTRGASRERAGEVAYALGQLRRAKAAPADLGPDPLLAELARVWREYEVFMRQRGLADIEEQYALAGKGLGAIPWLGPVRELHLCWFFDLEPLQLDILAALSRLVPAVTLWLPWEHPAHFGLLTEILAGVREMGFTLRREEGGEQSELTAALFALPDRPAATPLVRGLGAPRLGQEAELVGQEIKALAAEGVRAEEICLVIPDPDRYLPRLQQVLPEQGIPLALPLTVKLTAVPWVREFIKIWRAAAAGWDREGLLRVAASVYITAHLPPDYDEEALGWALFHLKWDLRGKEWLPRLARERKWLSARRQDGEQWQEGEIGRALARYEGAGQAIEAWLELGRRLAGQGPPRDQVGLLLEILTDNIGRLSPPGDSLEASRDREAWSRLNASLTEYLACSSLLGRDKPIGSGQFIEEILPWLEVDLVLREGYPGGVRLLTPAQVRGQSFPWLFILGLNQGVFPRPQGEHWLLDRIPRGDRDPSRTLARQKAFFHSAIAAAEQGICLSRQLPGIDEGAEASSFWREVEEACRDLPCRFLDSADLLPPFSQAASAERLAQFLAYDRARGRQLSPGALDWLAGRESYPALLRASLTIQNRESPAPADNYDGALAASALALKERFGRGVYSSSRLEQYYRCPWAFFADTCLGLAPDFRCQDEYSALEKGALLHWLLERFYREGYWKGAEADAPETITGPLAALARRWLERGGLDPEETLWRLRSRDAVWTVAALIRTDIAWRRRTGLVPVLYEAPFGLPGAAVGAVSPGEGTSLWGQVDRIDILERDGETWAVVYDYKTSQEVTRSKILSGRSLQIPTYLVAAQPLLAQLGFSRIRVVGGGYYVLKGAKLAGGIWDREFTDLARSNLASVERGELAGLQSLLAETARGWHEEILAGNFTPRPQDGACRPCPFVQCCRYDKYRLQVKGG